MTEETKNHNEQHPTKEVSKLSIDNQSDFKFHAAYLAYSETWDNIDSSDIRNELNDIIETLSKGEMDYTHFYKSLDEYRRRGSKHYEFSRQRIETQRKRDWRMKRNRQQRNSRHKGRH